MVNDKHRGPHCAGLCEGTAYISRIKELEAQMKWVDEINRVLQADAQRLAKVLGDIKWCSADKDNMEFTATIPYSQREEIWDALEGK